MSGFVDRLARAGVRTLADAAPQASTANRGQAPEVPDAGAESRPGTIPGPSDGPIDVGIATRPGDSDRGTASPPVADSPSDQHGSTPQPPALDRKDAHPTPAAAADDSTRRAAGSSAARADPVATSERPSTDSPAPYRLPASDNATNDPNRVQDEDVWRSLQRRLLAAHPPEAAAPPSSAPEPSAGPPPHPRSRRFSTADPAGSHDHLAMSSVLAGGASRRRETASPQPGEGHGSRPVPATPAPASTLGRDPERTPELHIDLLEVHVVAATPLPEPTTGPAREATPAGGSGNSGAWDPVARRYLGRG